MKPIMQIYTKQNLIKNQFLILIRNISKNQSYLNSTSAQSASSSSSSSSSDDLILSKKLSQLSIDNNGIASLILQSSPVNALGIDLFREMKESLQILEKEKPKGLILKSNIKTIFSAGLDLKELYQPDQDRIKILWNLLQDVCVGLYSASYPTVAAMNGHSIAGGCALAFACEYRVMLPKFMIGLNETRVGLHIPKWLIASTKNILPRRLAEAALLEGRLFTTCEALKFGLIDEIAKDDDDLIQKSQIFFNKFNKTESLARATTKQYFRIQDIEEFKAFRKEDLETFLFIVNQEKFQKNLGKYLTDLKNKKK
ncbi:enoyl-CoA delta isomerase 1, mitochondrial-like [Condylostylus longicornis]|uniref:enoyl-CoA delta isomerase 1, mitochondrial-like n=1 Tax=Condylostylus longicornis TaxID=2530218 RepID=UPI00244E34F6|nr:enoyl-CoA delta isomerase 1, mitochondrial-like [Condylostylus longicornis]